MSQPVILVTGGNGQLGNELREISSEFSQFNFVFIDKEEVDLIDGKAFESFASGLEIDYVINCAAYTAVDQAESDELNASLINSRFPGLLAGYCKNKNIRLIHISTDYVFDGNGNTPIDETSLPNPISVYGKTKLSGEREISAKLDNAYIIRTAWVYSAFGKNFVKTMLSLSQQRKSLDVVCDQIGTPTNAGDLARALISIIKQIELGNDSPGIYHYTNEGVTSWFDFAVNIFKLAHINCRVFPISSINFKTAAQRPVFSVLDSSKIKSQFKIEIPYWVDSLERMLKQLSK